MPRDVIIGLDLATKSGWAVLDLEGKRLDSGAWPLAPRKGRHKADRWVRFSHGLAELLRQYEGRVGVVAMERPFEGIAKKKKAKNAASTPTVAWGLIALAELAAQSRGVESVRFPPARVKLHAAGKGNASKLQVAKAVSKRFRHSVGAGDEADALAVALTAWERLDLEQLACGHVVEVAA